MAEIFISYSQRDKEAASRLASLLETKGYSVAWQPKNLEGVQFRDKIFAELSQARVVIVIWSESSIRSDWMLSEAARARMMGKLLPVKTADVPTDAIPAPFDALHTVSVDVSVTPVHANTIFFPGARSSVS